MPKILQKKILRNEKQKQSQKNPNQKSQTQFNISLFKKTIEKELTLNSENQLTQNNLISHSKKGSYINLYSIYITEIYNNEIISMINRLIETSKSLPDDLRNHYPLHSLLIKVTKELMLNELEIVYLSLYFDNFGWKNQKLDLMDNFIITSLSVKKFLNSETELIENYLNENYPGIIEKFNLWFKNQKEFKNNLSISPRLINERFSLLKKSYNTYCKVNYIDYNGAVDKILQMSLPYNEGIRNHNEKNESFNNETISSVFGFKNEEKKKKKRKKLFNLEEGKKDDNNFNITDNGNDENINIDKIFKLDFENK